MTKESIKILDLFAGAGGLSLGFDLVKNENGDRVFEIFRAVEKDEDACETLKAYFKKEYGKTDIVIEGNLTNTKTRKEIIRQCLGRVSVIVGGPPCQSFSMIGPRSGYGIGKKKYTKDRRDILYKEYLKIVKAVRPTFVIFENVKGIISKRDGRGKRYIDKIISDFKNMGYSFVSENPNVKEEFLILNAADYGVPQTRERVFLIGNNLGIPNPYPPKTHYNPRKEHPNNGLKSWTTLREAIGDLPALKAKFTYTDLPKSKIKKYMKKNPRRFSGDENLPFDKKKFEKHLISLPDSGQELLRFLRHGADGTLLYHKARPQKADDITLFAGMRQGYTAKHLFTKTSKKAKTLRRLVKYQMKTNKGDFTFGDKYRKQSWNKPSTTLFAHLSKDGNRFIHPESNQARTLTVREAARIQTFPDWYELSGSRGSKFKQIGNAVPPLLSMKLAEVIYFKLVRKS